MGVTLLLFTVGVFAKIATSLLPDLRNKDVVVVVGILFGSMLASIAPLVESRDIPTTAVVFLLVFVAGIAFYFKNRLLPKITEGTLFLYGFVALYFFATRLKDIPGFGVIGLLLILSWLMILILCIFRIRIRPAFKTFFVVCFLFFSLLIMSVFIQSGSLSIFLSSLPSNNLTNLDAFFMGYLFFQFACNCFFILYFIPLSSKSSNKEYKEEMVRIKTHAKDLEKKYLDIDFGFFRTLLLLTIIFFLFTVLDGYVSDVLIISGVLILGDLLIKQNIQGSGVEL